MTHRYTLVVLLLLANVFSAFGADVEVSSPDGKIKAVLSDRSGALTLTVSRLGKILLDPSPIGINIKDVPDKSAIRKSVYSDMQSETIDAPFYRQSRFTVDWNQAVATLDNGISVELRAYDEGVAYRFMTSFGKKEVTVVDETARYVFPSDTEVWLPYSTNETNPFAMAFQNVYDRTMISKAKTQPAFLPVTADCGNGIKLTILESDLESYPGMFVVADSAGHSLEGVFAHYPAATDFRPRRRQLYVTVTEDFIARTSGTRAYPWRIIAITDDDRKMPVNNLVYALASPSRVADTSWIRGGKVAWDWWNDWGLRNVPFKAGINTETYKHYIDFAAEHGIEYVVLDEGWYDPAGGDMLTVIPAIDLAELIAYGESRGVGIVLWTVFNVLDSQLEEACEHYADMGVKGFKVDFLDRDDQTGVEMAYRIADACARHKLFLDYHGFYKPTGLNRTYPNILNFEAVFGMEEVKWTSPEKNMPLYDVTFPYIRMMAGNVDYTPGAMNNATKRDWKAIYYNPMSMGTRAHQIAAYIVHDSPFTMLCDSPSNYRGEDECVDFITTLPVTFDSTAVIDGRMGESIVTARSKGDEWFVGGMTDWTPRNMTVDLSFLPAGRQFTAVLISDGPNADKHARDFLKHTFTVDNTSKIPVRLASGGGFALHLTPEVSSSEKSL